MGQRYVKVDADGKILLPPDIIKRLGILPGTELLLEEGRDSLKLDGPVSRLARIYVEPTTRCNLECSTCVRNAWDEPSGNISSANYRKILTALKNSDPVPEVFFGGFGEPLTHPDIVTMIRDAKLQGAHVELISNGILLNREIAEALVEIELDRMWISIDGAGEESYTDVRLRNEFERIKENVRYLKELRRGRKGDYPAIGLTFVAMKRNINEMPQIASLMYELGGDTLHISNVLPHTEEMKDEILYENTLDRADSHDTGILFPRMDINQKSWQAVKGLLSRFELQELSSIEYSNIKNKCPFIEKGSISVRHDGKISPCLPLLHSATSYLKKMVRDNKAAFFGSLEDSELLDVWRTSEYTKFRKKVKEFSFSPCTACTNCKLSEDNQEDCYGSVPISCGGCLWAQGIIQCP